MEYGKLKHGILEFAPHYIKTSNYTILDPQENNYLSHGFKKIIFEQYPVLTSENQKIIEKYLEDKTTITVFYEIIPEDENVIRQNRILTIKEELKELDFKCIRALREYEEFYDTENKITWLEYYKSQILTLREELKLLEEEAILNNSES